MDNRIGRLLASFIVLVLAVGLFASPAQALSFGGFVSAAKSAASNAVKAVSTVVKAVVNTVVSVAKAVVNTLVTVAKAVANTIVVVVQTIAKAIDNTVKAIVDTAKNIYNNVVKPIANGIVNTIKDTVNEIVDWVDNTIQPIRDVFSPTKVTGTVKGTLVKPLDVKSVALVKGMDVFNPMAGANGAADGNFLTFLAQLLAAGVPVGLAYGAYLYYTRSGVQSDNFEFTADGQTVLVASAQTNIPVGFNWAEAVLGYMREHPEKSLVGAGLTKAIEGADSWLFGGTALPWITNGWNGWKSVQPNGFEYQDQRYSEFKAKEPVYNFLNWVAGGINWVGDGLDWTGKHIEQEGLKGIADANDGNLLEKGLSYIAGVFYTAGGEIFEFLAGVVKLVSGLITLVAELSDFLAFEIMATGNDYIIHPDTEDKINLWDTLAFVKNGVMAFGEGLVTSFVNNPIEFFGMLYGFKLIKGFKGTPKEAAKAETPAPKTEPAPVRTEPAPPSPPEVTEFPEGTGDFLNKMQEPPGNAGGLKPGFNEAPGTGLLKTPIAQLIWKTVSEIADELNRNNAANTLFGEILRPDGVVIKVYNRFFRHTKSSHPLGADVFTFDEVTQATTKLPVFKKAWAGKAPGSAKYVVEVPGKGYMLQFVEVVNGESILRSVEYKADLAEFSNPVNGWTEVTTSSTNPWKV